MQEVLCLSWKYDRMGVFSGGCDKQVKIWPLMSGGQPMTEAGIRLSSTRTLGSKHKSIHNISQNAVTHSFKYPLMVVGTADRNLIVFNLNKPQVKCCAIMGREENEDLSPGRIMYPCMQCADILLLEVHHTFVTDGSDGAFNFMTRIANKDSRFVIIPFLSKDTTLIQLERLP
ncbi:hypothetical protein C5167_017979 [Papaver somniferum]|uniref:Uncharacterized protein n=1 Tax=Papaver somniferum TaxID=3469 RepID=A0A4Y7IN58_PAPSO|nr:hypothetical protein C5167_017979 [Papaver somniferum]